MKCKAIDPSASFYRNAKLALLITSTSSIFPRDWRMLPQRRLQRKNCSFCEFHPFYYLLTDRKYMSVGRAGNAPEKFSSGVGAPSDNFRRFRQIQEQKKSRVVPVSDISLVLFIFWLDRGKWISEFYVRMYRYKLLVKFCVILGALNEMFGDWFRFQYE